MENTDTEDKITAKKNVQEIELSGDESEASLDREVEQTAAGCEETTEKEKKVTKCRKRTRGCRGGNGR